MKTYLTILSLSLAATLGTGCGHGPNTAWNCSFIPEGGFAKLDSDGVAIVFEGVVLNAPAGGSGGGAGCSLKVSGSGMSENKLTALGKTLETSYRNGVNTITIDKFTVKLRESGHKAQIGEQVFDLSGSKKTIVIHKNGTATML